MRPRCVVALALPALLCLLMQRALVYCLITARPPAVPAATREIAEPLVLPLELLPHGLPGTREELLFLTFASASVSELLHNWVLHLQRMHLHAVVAAMEPNVTMHCVRLRVPCIEPSQGDADFSSLGADNFRGNPALFNKLGGRKVRAIYDLLRLSGRPLVVSDVDVVWLGDPTPLVTGALRGYEDFRHAQLLASTDCLDPEEDERDHGAATLAHTTK